jgi:dTDP-glucose 4,6-dehydratase
VTLRPLRPPDPRSALAGQHVVVTGGAGFVGSWTCEALLDAGARVLCVDSLVTGSVRNIAHLWDRPGFRFVEADVCEDLPAPAPVDVVLHLACPASPLHYLQLPLETLDVGSRGTARALRLAERHGARFLLASTSEVYGDPAVHPQPEDYWGHVNPIGPRSVYDEAKRFSEALTAAYARHGLADATIARIFNTYGPRMAVDDGRVVPTFVRQALAGEPLTVAGDGSQTRSLCYVTDTVEGLLRLACSGLPGPVNIGNDRELTVLELARLVIDVTGSTSEVSFVDLPEDDPRVRRPDLTLARSRLGWRASTPAEDGLARTVAWIQDEVEHQYQQQERTIEEGSTV